MTLLIDLKEHLSEVKSFTSLASGFVDKNSITKLEAIVRDLETGIALAQPEWTWETKHPVIFGPSKSYDGQGRVMPEAWARIEFCCRFTRPNTVVAKDRDSTWKIASSAVHITMAHEDESFLSCHFDYKNGGQWGPQMHVQLAEGDHRFPIPRLLSNVFLPTDCADLVLAELMPELWSKEQIRSVNSNHVSVLRRAQEERTGRLLADISSQWGKEKDRTRVSMLQNYTASFAALPNHLGKVPDRNWD